MHKILYLLLLPVLVCGQTAQETVERKLKSTTGQFQQTNESDFIVATPYIKSYAGIVGSAFTKGNCIRFLNSSTTVPTILW